MRAVTTTSPERLTGFARSTRTSGSPAAAAPKHAVAKHFAGEPSPWTWVDRGPKLLSVSCPAQGKCVAVGEGGAVLRSNGLSPLAWSRVSGLADDEDLVSVACRGSLC